METTQIKYTPLHDIHIGLKARMMPFSGFDMPVQYSGIVAEHHAVRSDAGLFDVSHMGEFIIEGPDASTFIQHIISNDITRLYDGKALYTVMCNESGGIIDDLLVYRFNEARYMLVVNASNITKDLAWVRSHNSWPGVEIKNISDQTALLAIQGPKAFSIVQPLIDQPLSELKYYHFLDMPGGSFLGLNQVVLSYTGYTGEQGLEIYCRSEDASKVWEALMNQGTDQGLVPAGLGARDTLRLESGFCLYGNDITDHTSPLAAGLGWITKLDKGEFVGSDALKKIKETSPEEKLVGFVLEERGIPRQGYVIENSAEEPIGTVTSGSQSPLLQKGIGLGYVLNEAQYTQPDQPIFISIRNKRIKARITKPPFHKN